MKPIINLIIITLLSFTLTSCELVGTIFKGGMWTGIILVLGVIVLVIWGVSKAFGGGGRS